MGRRMRRMTGGTAEKPSADMTDAAFARTLGITGEGDEALAALRALPAEALLGGLTFPVMTKTLLTQGITEFPGTPVIDGVIVTDKLERPFLGARRHRCR
jgi:hypothetical protein